MIKEEVAEIRKQFSKENTTITAIRRCYVNTEKHIVLEDSVSFGGMPEEEQEKYLDLFKKTLGGKIGQKLLNLAFRTEEEKEGGKQEFLMKLRKSHLKDDDMARQLFRKIVENYSCEENYLILAACMDYDVPGQDSNGNTVYDASDSVYTGIICSICPVKQTKASLAYYTDRNQIEERIRDWVVNTPLHGFLFPAFNDRQTDVHEALYYTSKATEYQPDFIDAVFGATIPMTEEEQKECLQALVEQVADASMDIEAMLELRQGLKEIAEEAEEDQETAEIGKKEIRALFEKSGVTEKEMEKFDETYQEIVGSGKVMDAGSLAGDGKLTMETTDVKVTVSEEYASMVTAKIVDGRACLMIPLDAFVNVNGISVRAKKKA